MITPWTDDGFVQSREVGRQALLRYIETLTQENAAVEAMRGQFARQILNTLAKGEEPDVCPDIPSPINASVIQKAGQYISRALLIPVIPGMVLSHSFTGMVVEDHPDPRLRRAYSDWLSAASAVFAHRDPVLLRAVLEGLHDGGSSCTPYFMNPSAAAAAEALAKLLPGKWMVTFAADGGNANEAAMKIALVWAQTIGLPQRTQASAFKGLYLGNQGMSGKLTGYGVSSRWGRSHRGIGTIYKLPDQSWQVSDFLRTVRTEAQEGKLAAFFVEAIPGDKGMQMPPTGLLDGLVNLLWGEFHIPVIFDEVQSFARTGKPFAWMHFMKTPPPIITMGKLLGNGVFATSVVLYNTDMVEISPGQMANLDVLEPPEQLSTYAATPSAMRLLQEILLKVTDPAFMADVTRKGEILQAGLQKVATLARSGNVTARVKGKGLMSGLEIWLEEPHLRLAAACAKWLARRGVIVGAVGNSTIRLHPTLLVLDVEIEMIVGLLKHMMQKLIDNTFDQDIMADVLSGQSEGGLDREPTSIENNH